MSRHLSITTPFMAFIAIIAVIALSGCSPSPPGSTSTSSTSRPPLCYQHTCPITLPRGERPYSTEGKLDWYVHYNDWEFEGDPGDIIEFSVLCARITSITISTYAQLQSNEWIQIMPYQANTNDNHQCKYILVFGSIGDSTDKYRIRIAIRSDAIIEDSINYRLSIRRVPMCVARVRTNPSGPHLCLQGNAERSLPSLDAEETGRYFVRSDYMSATEVIDEVPVYGYTIISNGNHRELWWLVVHNGPPIVGWVIGAEGNVSNWSQWYIQAGEGEESCTTRVPEIRGSCLGQ